jgi:hypothetical protein
VGDEFFRYDVVLAAMRRAWIRLDRSLALLLALFSAGHGFLGTLATMPFLASPTVWSFSGSLAAWLIAALNWLRAGRPGDRPLAAWALIGSLAWIGLMVWLAVAAEMVGDVRIWLFVGTCSALAAFSWRDLRRSA